MNKTLTVILGAMVILVAGLGVYTLFSDQINLLEDSGEDIKESGCDYQKKQFLRNTEVSENSISSNCKDAEWRREKRSLRALTMLNN